MRVFQIDESAVEESKVGHLIANVEKGFGFICLDPDDVFMEMPYSNQKKIIDDWVELLAKISVYLEEKNGGSIQ